MEDPGAGHGAAARRRYGPDGPIRGYFFQEGNPALEVSTRFPYDPTAIIHDYHLRPIIIGKFFGKRLNIQ
jgi:hypothetical protein